MSVTLSLFSVHSRLWPSLDLVSDSLSLNLDNCIGCCSVSELHYCVNVSFCDYCPEYVNLIYQNG